MNKILLVIALAFCFIDIRAQIGYKDAKKSMLTYSFSDPDPVARPGRIYPYFRFDGYTDKGVNKDWQFIDLENDYIKVSITPEIGGKIWGAIDKSTGFPFVYFNNVVKFRDIAMRGAWTSGGIEINFGDIGHDPTVSHPVDHFLRTNTDASVSCFIGAYDWASRTRWMVEVNLPKDKALFSTKSKWFNSSVLEQTYYHWMNAGFKADGDLEFAFPGSGYIGHGGELNAYPKSKEGRELQFYKNNNFGSYKSYHVLGKETDYFGGYWHENKVGFIHYSPYYEKLGKKIWIWGLSQEGMIWEDLLTDTDGQYVELQSGRLFNQAAGESKNSPFKHLSFEPYTTDSFEESWFPVNDIGGISTAQAWGASNISIHKNELKIAINSVINLNDTLRILIGEKESKRVLKLRPQEIYKEQLKFETADNIKVFVGKQIVFEQAPEPDSTAYLRPLESPTDFNWDSEYGLFLEAKGLYNQRHFNLAEEKLKTLLSKNPFYVPALGTMAQLMYRKAQFRETIILAQKALSINTYDGLANYTLGLSSYRLGEFKAASEAFSVAVLSPQFKTAAFTELAKLKYLSGDPAIARRLVSQALQFNTENEHAVHLELVLLRQAGQKNEAIELIEQRLASDPLAHFLRFEKYLITRNPEDLAAFKLYLRNEMPHENYIEMAIWYHDIGESNAAYELLENAPTHPMVSFWQNEIKPNKADLEKAIEQSPLLVFPFRVEEEAMLKKLAGTGSSWKINYYYGILLWHLNREDEAKAQFEICGNKPDFYPFYLAKARLNEGNSKIELEALNKALEIEPQNWRVLMELSAYYIKNKDFKKALKYNESLVPKEMHETYILGQQKAEILYAMGDFEACVAFMKNLNLLPNEGAKGAHSLFKAANLNQAIVHLNKNEKSKALEYLSLSETWPKNLGSGEPYEPDNKLSTALRDYLSDKNPNKLKSLKAKLSEKDQLILEKLKL